MGTWQVPWALAWPMSASRRASIAPCMAGGMQANEVADAAGLQARYVEEWLKGMTAAGYLEYDSAADAYALPEEHAFLLASEGTDHFMGGLFYVEPVVLGAAPKVADCFRTGGGVRFEDFGPECVVALDMINSGH